MVEALARFTHTIDLGTRVSIDEVPKAFVGNAYSIGRTIIHMEAYSKLPEHLEYMDAVNVEPTIEWYFGSNEDGNYRYTAVITTGEAINHIHLPAMQYMGAHNA